MSKAIKWIKQNAPRAPIEALEAQVAITATERVAAAVNTWKEWWLNPPPH